MEHEGVSLENPIIREYVGRMTKDRKSVEDISRVVGIPAEAVQQVQRDIKNRGKQEARD